MQVEAKKWNKFMVQIPAAPFILWDNPNSEK